MTRKSSPGPVGRDLQKKCGMQNDVENHAENDKKFL